MLRYVSAVVGCVALSVVPCVSAHAQIPQRWSGPYVGVNIGHGSADFGSSATDTKGGGISLSDSFDANGVFGGIQAGYNYRIGNFFVGVEADLNNSDFSASSKASLGSLSLATSASIDWFATARARAGFANNAMLVYVTGGFAFGGIDYDATVKSGKSTFHLSEDARVGYVLGAGMEFALRSNWSLKLEYQYLNFGSQGASDTFTSIMNQICAPPIITSNTVSANVDTDIHTLRIGLNYQFYAPQRHDPLKP